MSALLDVELLVCLLFLSLGFLGVSSLFSGFMAWMGFPLRGRGGVKTPPRGKRDFGKKDSWKEDASKPPVAQRAGGISIQSARLPHD